MTDEEEVRRGHQAKSELTQTEAVFDRMIEAAMIKWRNTTALNTDIREELWRTVVTLEAVRDDLRRSVIAGDNASKLIELKNS